MSGSLAFRKNEAAIRRGDIPDKYTRLLPFVTGHRILELGSAEGVLALILAREGRQVTAVERNETRHAEASRLYADWLAREGHFVAPTFINGDIAERLDLLQGQDTLAAIRMIYYLRGKLDIVFAAAAKCIPTVILCGNRNRAARWRSGVPDDVNGPVNFYASEEGMAELLKRHGYTISEIVTDGDPIVVGRMG